MGTHTPGDRRTVQSVERACEIVAVLKNLDGAGVTEIADRVGMSKGSVHTYLSTLKQNDYVTEADGVYRIGLRFLEVGEYAKRQEQLYRHGRSPLDELAVETGELVRLVVEEHGRGVYLYKAAGENAIETTIHPGQREHLHCTAQGKAILSQLPESTVLDIVDEFGLPARTENTITELEDLLAELERIRERGVAFSDGEATRRLRCVAAPIQAPNGEPMGALGVFGPTSRLRDERFDETLPNAVTNAANIIEINMQMAATS